MEKVEEAILILSRLLFAVSSRAEIIAAVLMVLPIFYNIQTAINAAKDGDVKLTVIGRQIYIRPILSQCRHHHNN